MAKESVCDVRVECLRAAHQVQLDAHQLARSCRTVIDEAGAFEQFVDKPSSGWAVRLQTIALATEGRTRRRSDEVIATAKEYAAFLSGTNGAAQGAK